MNQGAPSASISPSTSFSSMGLTARAPWSFARSCAAARFSPPLQPSPLHGGPGTVWPRSLLGTRDRQSRPHGEADRASVRETLRQAPEE